MSGYPNEPPPNYEATKGPNDPSQYGGQPYPPQGGQSYPPQGQGYPQGQYPPQGSYPPQGQYPPQQGQYPPQQGQYQQPPATVVVTQPQPQVIVVNSVMRLGPNPMAMQCPHCHQQIVTAINFESGALTWISIGVLLLFGCWLGCCLIPLCVDACKDVRHTCPNCRQHLGVYSRLS